MYPFQGFGIGGCAGNTGLHFADPALRYFRSSTCVCLRLKKTADFRTSLIEMKNRKKLLLIITKENYFHKLFFLFLFFINFV